MLLKHNCSLDASVITVVTETLLKTNPFVFVSRNVLLGTLL